MSLLSPLLFVTAAFANERHFTYTYDAEVLPIEAREIELWTTFLPMKDGMLDMKQRAEVEFAVSPRLMSAFYLNWSAGMHGSSFDGVSSEWKLNLLSRTVNPVGLALYAEIGVGPEEAELEAKVILDKEVGKLLIAYNLVGEMEIESSMSGGEVESEIEYVMEHDVGIAFRVSPHFSAGVELRNHTEFPEGEFEHSAFFVGPTLAVASANWWGAVTVLPQVYAIHDEAGLVLDEHVMDEVRVLLGFHF